MANKTATFQVSYTYDDEDDEDLTKTVSTSVLYTSSARGELDVPNATAGSTAYAIPFGSIAGATGVWLKNSTGQDLTLTVNAVALQLVKTGGSICIADPAQSAAPITAITLTTTAQQSGAGTIRYLLLGDAT